MDTNEQIEQQLDKYFMNIFNMVRGGITDSSIRLTADFYEVPQWIVMRIAHDLRTLTPEQEDRYQTVLEQLTQVEGKGACSSCGSSRDACDARIMKHPRRCCPACKESGPALNHEDK